jgi:hypothetical protein
MGGFFTKIFHKTGTDNFKDGGQKSFFDFKFRDIYGKIVDFNIFQERKLIMVVNVACK